MANSSQSRKRIRQNIKKRMINKINLSIVRTYIKRFLITIIKKNYRLAFEEYKLLISKLDKGVNKGVLHKNRANRLKRRFNCKLKCIS